MFCFFLKESCTNLRWQLLLQIFSARLSSAKKHLIAIENNKSNNSF